MVAEREMCTVIDVAYKGMSVEARCTTKEIACQVYEDELQEIVDNPIGSMPLNCLAAAPIPDPSQSELDLKPGVPNRKASVENGKVQFVPVIRSGSFADIGHRRSMEDEHIRIDDLSEHLGPYFDGPTPTAYYGVFDGHCGSSAAVFIRQNLLKFIMEDVNFPQFMRNDGNFINVAEKSVRDAFLVADNALADDCDVEKTCGTTVLTTLIFGRNLMVANVGDCRAVLSRRGKAVAMSTDHKPGHPSERSRIEALGGYVDDGYLNGELSVARALGDWDLKLPKGSNSPLSAEPEFREAILTEEDEFLIIGSDGIWDVMKSEEAVSIARRELMLHNNPEQCSKELVLEALKLGSHDNLTVVVVCFSADPPPCIEHGRLRLCSISSEGLRKLKGCLDKR